MSQEANKRSDIQAANEKAQAVKRDHEVELMGRANVVGVGVGLRQRGGVLTDEVALVVMVRQKMSSSVS